MLLKKILWLTLIGCFAYICNAQNNSLLPQPTAWVNDYAGLLDDKEKQLLNDSLQILEKMSSTQIYVAIVEKLPDNYDLEKYSYDLASEWKIGQKEKNNGVLLLVSLSDRQMRIEVGYGLEGVLTDAICSRIIRNEILPRFKSRDYYAGLAQGCNSITKAVRGEYKSKDNDDGEAGPGSIILIIIIIVFVMIFGRRGRSGSNRSGRGMWIGSSGSGWSGFSGGGGGFSGGGGGSFGGGGASGSW